MTTTMTTTMGQGNDMTRRQDDGDTKDHNAEVRMARGEDNEMAGWGQWGEKTTRWQGTGKQWDHNHHDDNNDDDDHCHQHNSTPTTAMSNCLQHVNCKQQQQEPGQDATRRGQWWAQPGHDESMQHTAVRGWWGHPNDRKDAQMTERPPPPPPPPPSQHPQLLLWAAGRRGGRQDDDRTTTTSTLNHTCEQLLMGWISGAKKWGRMVVREWGQQ